mmetsp:Transcript_7181/g.11353  ORF Transcript_7181/g.11353 Transcript_7181/m.11353 type:complete len:85 (-) Transcript_7181:351-605(-)
MSELLPKTLARTGTLLKASVLADAKSSVSNSFLFSFKKAHPPEASSSSRSCDDAGESQSTRESICPGRQQRLRLHLYCVFTLSI